jgi:hypothetical protein
MMRVHQASPLLPFVIAAAVASPAHAAPPSSRALFTPPVHIEGAGVAALPVTCGIVNVQDEARTVQTELVQNDNIPVLSVNVTVVAGKVGGISTTVPPGFFVRSVYCRFRVVDGANSDIRASIQVEDPVNISLPAH